MEKTTRRQHPIPSVRRHSSTIRRIDNTIVDILPIGIGSIAPVDGEIDSLTTGTKHSKAENEDDDLGAAVQGRADEIVVLDK